jgi:hypothetical protein
MIYRGHTRETVGLLNVNSIHLNTSLMVGRGQFKCIEFTSNNPTVSLV